MSERNRGHRDFATLKIRAKNLIVYKGYTKKAAAMEVGVNEKTIASWVRQYAWTANIERSLTDTQSANNLMDFIVYVARTHPRRYPLLKTMYDEYISGLK